MKKQFLIFSMLFFIVSINYGCSYKTPKDPAVVKEIITEVMIPPDYLFMCRDLPVTPEDPITDSKASEYIARLHNTAKDCWDSLNNVKKWIEETKQKYVSSSNNK